MLKYNYMGRFVLLMMFVLISNIVQGQYIVKEFFDKDGKLTTEDKSYYYRIGEKVILKDDNKDFMFNRMDTVFVDTVFTFYSYNDQLRAKEFYENGAIQGGYEYYYSNGNLKEKGISRGIRKDGTIEYWYENGNPHMTLYYTMVRSFLILNYWDKENNQIVKDETGICSCYLENDSIREEGKVKNGYRDGVWKAYLGNALRYEEVYKNQKLEKGVSHYQGETFSYKQVEEMAQHPHGMNGMFSFLRSNIRYPSEAKKNRYQGKVFVKFIIDKNGFIMDPTVVKSAHSSLDEEALRVVRMMKRWEPGKQRGIPVKSQFVLPIMFSLD